MVAPTSAKFAFKSVLRRKQKNLFTILGITLGVALLAGVQIGVDSLTVGWQNSYIHTLGEREVVYTGIKDRYFNESIAEKLQQSVINGKLDHVEGVTGRVDLYATVFWANEGTIETGINFVGVSSNEPSIFGKYFNEDDSPIELNEIPTNQIIVGRGLVELMRTEGNELNKGDSLYLSIYDSNMSLVEEPLEIYDIYEDKGKGREGSAIGIIVLLDWIQQRIQPFFTGQSGYNSSNLINTIYCGLDETIDTTKESNAVIRAISEEMAKFGVVDPFYKMNMKLFILDLIADIMSMLGDFMWIFGSVIMFCGLLLITNIQMMSVEEREIQTGIMRAIGTKKRQIIFFFLTEAVFLGIVGAVFGLFSGAIYGWILVQMFGYFFGFSAADMPLIITSNAITISFIAGFIVALITGIFPAIRASNVNIVQVIRGILPPSEEQVGRKGLYLGIIMTVIGIILLVTNPVDILQGSKAFERLNDAEAFYLPVLLTLVGGTLTASYFVISRKAALEMMTGVLIFWPLFNIFIIFDWIKEGGGGVMYLIYIIFSMIIGAIAIVGLNLDLLANACEFVVGSVRGLSAVATLAFRQMASQKTRSTLTFAIFASVLTLNIFVATWTYSTRFGYDSQVDETSGGMDLLAIASIPVAESLDYANLVKSEYNDITFAAGFTFSESAEAFTEDPEELGYIPFNDESKKMDSILVSLDETVMWDQREWQFPLFLENKKLGPFNSTEDTITDDEKRLLEDEQAWQAVANNTYVDDDGNPVSFGGKPVIITSLYTFEGFSLSRYPIGDSLWLLDSTGEDVIEFKVIAAYWDNPIAAFTLMGMQGAPVQASAFFVSKAISSNLAAFTQNKLNGTENAFVFKTKHDLHSEGNKDLANEIESWSNKPENAFRTTYTDGRMHGIQVVQVWDIYEEQLEGMYRFFQFIQLFTGMGFLVGVLGLLVVAVRSVTERKREIGMMRSIGFTRFKVVLAVLIELVTMGLIGLIIGLVNGNLLGWALVDINSGGDATFLIPWHIILLYTVVTLGAAFLAAIIPGWRAQKIPPSEALRYTG